jgi:hypothetical protein
MNRILLALLFGLGFGASALADGRVFPPDNCSTSSPFMAFSAIEGSNTYCTNGQDIFHNAIPACAADQIVAFNGASFYCKSAADAPPNCGPNQVLTFANDAYACVAAGEGNLTIPSCSPPQVLTGSGGSLTCTTPSTGASCGARQHMEVWTVGPYSTGYCSELDLYQCINGSEIKNPISLGCAGW